MKWSKWIMGFVFSTGRPGADPASYKTVIKGKVDTTNKQSDKKINDGKQQQEQPQNYRESIK